MPQKLEEKTCTEERMIRTEAHAVAQETLNRKALGGDAMDSRSH